MKPSARYLTLAFILMMSVALLQGCTQEDEEESGGESCANALQTKTISYVLDLKPLLSTNCLGCHGAVPSVGAHEPLTTYDTMHSQYALSKQYVQLPRSDSKHMPQGDTLSRCELETFLKWEVDGFAP